MGPGTIPHPVRRTWTVEVRPQPGGPVLVCPHCGPVPTGSGAAAGRAAVVAHLAQHARTEPLAPHLRTCQCGRLDCRWHPRHSGCDGTLLLLLSRDRTGRVWKLADVCRACAAATEHAAAVTEPNASSCLRSGAGPTPAGAPLPHRGGDAGTGCTSTVGMSDDAQDGAGYRDEVVYRCTHTEEGLGWADEVAYG